ncbi:MULTISPECIES: malonic semialdehyde reductase [unclassified Beijerinckia]|uniref:malonic semialdehyde reductase n=1 Tax=unclassified Beijerinckia TaxID=2638183 RepID=UPI00089D9D1E|nr:MULTISPECIES: malonic semialdehyde reductase [unclassified Beijerinckia]MDH7799235.1 3-hydroxypropanoate dehydrogenase [Beijerinckia sp. GAS462]SED91154.1 3-hydroxypropanoate dehydrogenase [Beijerinckia sp. 28-YEA-48]
MLDDPALDLLFRRARSQNGWLPRPVEDDLLRELWNVLKWGPTSANCSPMRLIFLRTAEAKARLKPYLGPANIDKTMTAPVAAIIGYDTQFYRQLPTLFPHNSQAEGWFSGEERQVFAAATALRNGSLQGGYFIVAARALGLDCGPISGFDHDAVDAEFWSGTTVRTNFICNIGYGSGEKLFDRLPRLEVDEVCSFF